MITDSHATQPTLEQRRSLRRVMSTDRSSIPASLRSALWSDPSGLIASGEMLKDGDRCTVVAVTDESWRGVLKRYNLKDPLHTTVHAVMRSRARWSWRNGWRLIESGVPTPRPVAMVEDRVGPLRLKSYLLTEFVEGRPLRDVMSEAGATEAVEPLVGQFLRIWEQLGGLRASHGDMKDTNFIVDPTGQLWLVDLDGMRFHAPGPLFDRARRRDFAIFMRNWTRPWIPVETARLFRARLEGQIA